MLKFVVVCHFTMVFILFLMIDFCFAKGGEVANQIFAYKKDGLSTSIAFLSHIVLFGFVLYGYSL
jgi:hypothetical protein